MQRLVQVMAERVGGCKVVGTALVDDAYLGGMRPDGKRNEGSENKTLFRAAVQVTDDGRP